MRHRAAYALSVVMLGLGLAWLVAPTVSADQGLTLAGTIPNHYYALSGNSRSTGYASEEAALFSDPERHLLFESNRLITCPSVFVLDDQSYQVLAKGTTQGTLGCDPSMTPPGTSLVPPVAIDSKAGLLLVADNQGSGSASDGVLVSSGVPVPVLRVASERSLTTVATWRVPTSSPSGPQNAPMQGATTGLSYYAPLNEALVMVGSSGNQAGDPITPGLSVVAYNVQAGLKQGSPSVDWTLNVTQCEAPLEPQFASAAAYHSTFEDALYVPCVLSGAPPLVGAPGQFERDGVVRIPMTHTGCTPPATECPNANGASVAVAPGVSEDALFDAGSDRMLLPSTSTGVVEVLVYDGHLNQFLGASVVGGPNDTAGTGGSTAMGLDPVTGRLYVVNSSGLLMLDARRTPVTPGAVFPQFAEAQFKHSLITTAPPDAAHPYTRVIVNHDRGYTAGNPTGGYMTDFRVFADTIPVSTDPPPAAVDANTLNGAAPKGATLQETFGGTARGYGFHSDLVGGPSDLGNVGNQANGALNLQGLPSLRVPLGQGNRDVLGGTVERLNIQNGSVDGRAAALGIADDSTAFGTQQCTDLQQTVNCLALPTCDQFTAPVAPGTCPSLPAAPSSSQPTGQLPPFPDAQCSQPGRSDDRTKTYDGAYQTTWAKNANGDWVASQSQISGTDKTDAHATVDCSPTATATGWLGGTQLLGSSTPNISVAQSQSSASVAPPSKGTGVVSSVTAWAHGIHIDLGGGRTLDIAEVSQSATAAAAGTAGSATGSDIVTVSGVSLNGAPLCGQQCDPTSLAAVLNQALPTDMFIDFPALEGHFDTRFLHCPDAPTQSAVKRSCTGSPGGYIAAIEANSTEQFGDEQFNGMNADVASFLPAMRVIVYFSNDGNPARTREVFDVAGVEADAERGFSALLPPEPEPPATDFVQAVVAAVGTPASTQYIPGTPGTNGTPPDTTIPTGSGPLGVLTRTLAGLEWLLRSPLAALQTIGFLGVLALPLVLARRKGDETI